MKNTKKSILKEKERKKLIDNATVIHQIVEEISEKRKKRKWEILKHPLFILFAGAIISGVFVFEYQNRQASIAEKEKAKYELLKEVSSYTGKLLAMAENVVYLHQKPITNSEQILNTNIAFNAAYDDFNSNFIRIDYKLKIIFKNDDINMGWADIRKGLKELNDLLDLLHEFPTNKISVEHSERIERCKQKVEKIKEKIDLLSDFMIKVLG